MRDGSKPLEEKLTDWLESQGYPLEMHVANCFHESGFSTSLSDYYRDFETGQSREIDVTASRFSDFKNPTMVQVCCRIECKLARDKPWVVFVPQSQPEIAFPFYLTGSLTIKAFLFNVSQTSDFRQQINKSPLFYPKHVGYGVTQAFDTGKDIPYQAIMGSVKSSIARVTQIEDLTKQSQGRHRYFGIVFPAIVIDGKLFEAHLIGDGQVKVEEVVSSVVHWKGSMPDNAPTLVYIITRPVIRDFVSAVDKAASLLIGIVEERIGELAELSYKSTSLIS